LLGCAINFLGHWRAWNSVRKDKFSTAFAQTSDVSLESGRVIEEYKNGLEKFQQIAQTGNNIVMGTNIAGNEGNRLQWLQVLKAINESLPQYPTAKQADDIGDRNEIHLEQLELEYAPDLAVWYRGMADKFKVANEGRQPP